MKLSLLLAAISLVESNNVDTKIGHDGERSRYQITQTVWHQHYPKVHFSYCRGVLAETCAIRHINWLIRNGVKHQPYAIAYAWNGGLARYLHFRRLGPASARSIRYARDVEYEYVRLLYRKAATRAP